MDTSSPLRNADGEIIGVIATVSDITERKQGEEEVARSRILLQACIESPAGQ